jgi:superfamily II DNA or RNA helicase
MDNGYIADDFISVDGATVAEDLFVELFVETYGLDKVQYLVNEYPLQDIYGGYRYIDYALKTVSGKIALEIDGELGHNPIFCGLDKYQDDLLKRNSIIHNGWKLFIWTYRQLVNNREQVKSELKQFLGHDPSFRIHDDYLPYQRGKVLELRTHQQETLDKLAELREEYCTMALIADAQGTGKTTTAVLDAKRMGLPTLFVAHTLELLEQAERRFKELWPDKKVQRITDFAHIGQSDIVVASIQGMHLNLNKFKPDQFGYIIIDEAHHAAAESYRKVINYFNPSFLLGLTATPERHDQESIMDIFKNEAHRLDLKTAVEIGELVPIRCVRIKTNIDFTKVRFKGITYNYRDLDEKIHIPDRNRLIVDTYLSHVPNRQTVVFCASVKHARVVAQMFIDASVEARSVDGKMKRQDREAVLEAYRKKEVKVLCACDILNEGWDSPDTEVLFMARPTLSKVIYLQQLGRGTRKAPGKDCLLVFDFIDNTTRYNHSVNLHRLLKQKEYVAGAFILAPKDEMNEERQRIINGEKPEIILPHNIYAIDHEIVDIFDWQEEIKEMISMQRLARELYVDDSTVRNWINTGKITPGPDFEVSMGNVTYKYFEKSRVDTIREQLGIEKRNPGQMKEIFMEYVKDGTMSASLKPVMLKGMLTLADSKGQVDLMELTRYFRKFYEDRADQGLAIEVRGAVVNRIIEMDDYQLANYMLKMPFEKFERKYFVEHKKELNKVAFSPNIWRKLSEAEKEHLINICDKQIRDYYERRVD